MTTVTYKNISFEYPDKVVFKNLDLTIQTGELLGILGPSGSGKTTLTKILLGKEKVKNPQFICEREGKKEKPELIGWTYVPQQNLLRENFSVNDMFSIYSSFHTLGKNDSRQEQEKVNEILESLGLLELRKKKISKLSGGEKRRVSIGIELLSDSDFLIFDEPSSGLDAYSDFCLLRILKKLAHDKDKAIIVITHKTENLVEFDQLIFLGKGIPRFTGNIRKLIKEFNDRIYVENYLSLSFAEVYKNLNDFSED
ncbi:MAG: ABC transporter ATP-binding protein [Streptococcaceae bacterium]|jgi:ABC-type multidrug transport system ATPase subunit|nr:ABC transporter ATP-binding protein [Streptococcaceae bacterium]